MSIVLNGTTGVTAPGLETFGDGTALGGATNPIVSMAKGANNYVQSYIVNNTNGTSSSADMVAYPSNGADAHGWVDMGITSLGYADTTYTVTGPNESYLFASAPSSSSTTGNLVIATDNTGTANSIQFYTNGFTQAKSAAKMVIDGATGNVGIGTSSPSTYVNGFNNSLVVTGGSNSAVIQSRNDGPSGTTQGIRFGGNYQTNPLNSAFIYYGFSGASGQQGLITFNTKSQNDNTTQPAEAARFDINGNFLVATTATGGRQTMSFDNAGQSGIRVIHSSTTYNGQAMVFLKANNSTSMGAIYCDGSTTSYSTSSDYRLKKNMLPMIGALSIVQQLKPCTYTWKESGVESQGFIAHELQEVCPSAVIGEKDAVNEDGSIKAQDIDTSFLVATLTAAIQEQQALITQLQADVEALKAKA